MRSYAPFFQWPDRQQAELGVVEVLIRALHQRAERSLHSPRVQHPDPPDCVCLNEDNRLIAVEVTEVVSAEAARRVAQGEPVLRNWQRDELEPDLRDRLADKDSKIYQGGPYSEVIACLFTDEPLLTPELVESELVGKSFGPFRQLTSAYLVLSYVPTLRTYPVYKLW